MDAEQGATVLAYSGGARGSSAPSGWVASPAKRSPSPSRAIPATLIQIVSQHERGVYGDSASGSMCPSPTASSSASTAASWSSRARFSAACRSASVSLRHRDTLDFTGLSAHGQARRSSPCESAAYSFGSDAFRTMASTPMHRPACDDRSPTQKASALAWRRIRSVAVSGHRRIPAGGRPRLLRQHQLHLHQRIAGRRNGRELDFQGFYKGSAVPHEVLTSGLLRE